MGQPYFRTTAALGGNSIDLGEDPLRPGELMLTAESGVKVRVRLDEQKAVEVAAALTNWYDTSYVEMRSYGGFNRVIPCHPEGRVATDEEVAEEVA
jgi:hypothetical protein